MTTIDSQPTRPAGGAPKRRDRKKLLAVALLVIMAVLVARALGSMYDEGDAICREIRASVRAVPSRQMPCSATSSVEADGNPFARRVLGISARPIVRRYTYKASGALRRYTVDLDGDGSTDMAVDCSVPGKMLLPLTHYRMWSGSAAFQGLRAVSKPLEHHTVAIVDSPQFQVRTKLEVLGLSAFGGFAWPRATTRDRAGQLVRRASYRPLVSMWKIIDYAYDARGDLQTRRVTHIRPPYAVVQRTDYSYQCWGP